MAGLVGVDVPVTSSWSFDLILPLYCHILAYSSIECMTISRYLSRFFKRLCGPSVDTVKSDRRCHSRVQYALSLSLSQSH